MIAKTAAVPAHYLLLFVLTIAGCNGIVDNPKGYLAGGGTGARGGIVATGGNASGGSISHGGVAGLTSASEAGSNTAPGTDGCDVGAEGCACYGNNTCNVGLACAAGVCGGSGSGGSTGVGGASGRGETSSTGGAIASGGNGGLSTNGGAMSTGGNATGGSTPATGGVATGGVASGGRANGGSSSAAGGGSSCSNVNPCGGNLVGTWAVTSSCLKVTGQLDVSPIGLGCRSASITGGVLHVTGTWTANSDGSIADNTVTSGDETLTLAAQCLKVSGTTITCEAVASPLKGLGYSALTCANAASGGCECNGTVQQDGGLGLVSTDVSTSSTYTTSGNVLTIPGSTELKYDYCVSGNQMTVTPQTTTAKTGTVTGAVVLQKQ
jgi:hypothetical protein